MAGMDVLLIVFLTLFNGAFAMSEMALASSRKARLAALHEAGDKSATAALALLDQPTQFLSTVQVGITSIGMLNGILGEAAFSNALGRWLQGQGMAEAPAAVTATALVVAGITFFTIIFGELVPKRIGQMYPEAVARWVARPMATLARLAGPFVRLLSMSTQGVLRLMRINNQRGQEVTEEEITASLAEGVSAGLIEEHEHQMVRNVFHLDDRSLTSMMTPHTDIAWLDASLSPAQALAQINALPPHQQHSWYPVCREGLAHVQGVIGLTQLLALPPSEDRPIEHFTRPADFVPETQTGMELLERLRDQSSRMVFVVDEYGEVQGLVTPLDVLQAITGELKSDTQTEAWATQREDGSWLLDGLMPVSELKARLELGDLPDEDKGRYNTLAGLLLLLLGRLPQTGEKIPLDNWEFEIVDLDGRRIDKVIAVAQKQEDH
jgi:putative hemolysin